MATIIIDNDNSIEETAASQAFQSSAGGSFTVATDGFVMASGATLSAVSLSHTSPWTVTVNGIVSSTGGGAASALAIQAAGVSKLTVGETGSIFSTGNGIYSDGSLSLTNAGLIEAGPGYGVQFAVGSNTVKNTGTIKNDGTYHLIDFSSGVAAEKNTVTNSGTIAAGDGSGAGNAIQSASMLAADVVTNTGTILGNVFLGDGKNTLTNSAWIVGNVQTMWNDDKITNAKGTTTSGYIAGNVETGGGKDTLTNAGEIQGGVYLGDDDDTFTNSGVVLGRVDLGHGNNTLTNSGSLASLDPLGVVAGDGNDKVTNSGQIHIKLDLMQGDNVVTNSGSILGPLLLGGGNDSVTTSGTIGGIVTLGLGTNTLTQTAGSIGAISGDGGTDTLMIGGTVLGTIDLGGGNDKVTMTGNGVVSTFGGVVLGAGDDAYIGNGQDEFLSDSDGSDKVALGAGGDIYSAAAGVTGVDGNDEIDGGAGLFDFYDAYAATSALTINLGTADFNHAAVGLVVKSKATGVGVGDDKILNFERARSGFGNDTVVGSAVANGLTGGDGADYLFGLAGNDTLIGGGDAAKDRLYGGLGADILYGGDSTGPDSATDFFFYETIAESTLAIKGRDTIMDFETGKDRVDLSAIDANTKIAGNDPFAWLGQNTPFSGVGGELRYFHFGSDLTVLYGDTNGDKKADFAISFTGQLTLSSGDFVL